MADQTPDQLTAATTLADTDLFMIYVLADSVLKKVAASVLIDRILASVGGTYLQVADNLSDLNNVASARANLGLGTAALSSAGAFAAVANNLSDLADPATARGNLAAAPTASPTITGGMTLTGPIKGNVQALSGSGVDVSVSEGFTKSISSNTTFTFTGATAGKLMGFVLQLTISSSAVPTWPASVNWEEGVAPTLGNGDHLLTFVTLDGGTNWWGSVFATNAS